jgi:hypothetical protein
MNSEVSVAISHALTLSVLAVCAIRAGRTRWYLGCLPLIVAALSWSWLRASSPRDGPAWTVVVTVALYSVFTLGVAHRACAWTRNLIGWFVLTLLGSALSIVPAAILSYLMWGVVTAF